MKAKMILSLIAIGFVLSSCAGGRPATVDSSGNLQPSLQNFAPGDPSGASISYDSSLYRPQSNADGSITLFSIGNFPIKISPFTRSGTRGALNRTNDEFDLMIAQYSEAVKSNPQDYDACIVLAGLYIDRGKPGDAELAIKYSDQALSIGTNNAQALYARALSYDKQGDSPKALSDLEVVLKTNVQSMKGVYYVMGVIYYKDNKVEEAIDAFEKVKTLDPEFVDTDEILEVLYGMRG